MFTKTVDAGLVHRAGFVTADEGFCAPLKCPKTIKKIVALKLGHETVQ